MNKKKTLLVGVGIILVCFLISGIYMFVNRSTSRAPTQAEMDAYAPYAVDWTAAAGEAGMTEKEIILSLCTYEGEETIGQNIYKSYTSDTLADHLYQCQSLSEVVVSDDGILHISYTDTNGRLVFLGYREDGLYERAVYDEKTDTMFHELEGTAVVWSNFRNGIQWGAA